MNATLDRVQYERMCAELGDACRRRYHSALAEGKTENEAFTEMVDTILSTYVQALAS